jgi:ABC-type Na+ efflux pump permease subunit
LSDRPLGGRLTVARRDLSSLSREKTIVLALVIQLFVALFSSFLVVGLASLYSPDSVEGGPVEVAVVGDGAEAFTEAAREVEGLRTRTVGEERATRAFEIDRVQAVVEVERVGGQLSVTATIPANSLRKTLVVVRLRAALEVLERTERVARADQLEADLVSLPPEVAASQYFGFSYTVLVPLLLLLPVFISGSVVVDSVTEEVERGTLELLRVAPVSLSAIVEGKALTAAALAPAQAALWVGLLSVNGIAVANAGVLVGYVAALSVVVVACGVAIALRYPDRGRAQLVYSLGIVGSFAAGAYLPEHPATTAALLAIDSPGPLTYASVGGYAVLAVLVTVLVRVGVDRTDPERL